MTDTTYEADNLGRMLNGKFETWERQHYLQHQEWLKCLRAFNKQNEPYVGQMNTMHDHIYVGSTLTKCVAGYARLDDAFSGDFWDLDPSPESSAGLTPEEAGAVADRDKIPVDDYLVDIDFDNHKRRALLELTILGSGCLKGVEDVIFDTGDYEYQHDDDGNVIADENGTAIQSPVLSVKPKISSPSVFNVFVDPSRVEWSKDLSVFERHVVSRSQLSELRNDARFDSTKINHILEYRDRGAHSPRPYEISLRKIAHNINNWSYTEEDFDMLEYNGMVSGDVLNSSGYDADRTSTYWCKIWVCDGLSLACEFMPIELASCMYHIMHYFKAPHKFWGLGVAFLDRECQYGQNDVTRDYLDALAFAAKPMAEYNINKMADGASIQKMTPGQVFAVEGTQPGQNVIQFFQPNAPTSSVFQAVQMFRDNSDDATLLPRFSYGDTSAEQNQTAKGLGMQLGVAALPTKVVIQNIERGGIIPILEGLYQFHRKYYGNGTSDAQVIVKVSSVLMEKEANVEKIIKFIQLSAASPEMVKRTNFDYLHEELAKNLGLDPEKVILTEDKVKPEGQQPDPVAQAKAKLMEMQSLVQQATAERVKADTVAKLVEAQYEANQAGLTFTQQSAAVGDAVMDNAGYQKPNPAGDYPEINQQPMPVQQNTSPALPPVPQSGTISTPQPTQVVVPNQAQSPMQGIETPEAG